jgi:hypothetical protein
LRAPKSIAALEQFGRSRLSHSFFMRDFLYSDISNIAGIPNIPDDPELAIEAGMRLCEEILEPLQARFGRIAIRSAFRSSAVNRYGNENGFNCARNEANYADHIWDRRDAQGRMGATACIVIPWFADEYEKGADWRSIAWWIHDHLPYSSLYFFNRLCAFNIQWREQPERRIDSYIAPKGTLTKKGMPNWEGDHSETYSWFPKQAKGL